MLHSSLVCVNCLYFVEREGVTMCYGLPPHPSLARLGSNTNHVIHGHSSEAALGGVSLVHLRPQVSPNDIACSLFDEAEVPKDEE